jgi:UDP-N-acetylglucosamine--N-acetylmuramyl-(pentapeptide) pyrophosphoryl-undecaprenol N-acetylglucosamine transferase
MSEQKLHSLAITCGGTGGHFYPGLSIARHFSNNCGKVVLLLSGINIETQSAEAECHGIATVKLHRMPSPRGISGFFFFIIGFIAGFFQSRRELKKVKAQALLGMGSFTSFPAALAALSLRIPLILHDGNARIGKANRILSRWSRYLGTAFPAVNSATVKCPCECTGMPLRPELAEQPSIDKSTAVAEINRLCGSALNPDLTTLLIFGGSQGAAVFNQTFPDALKNYPETFFQVIHLTGNGKFDEVKKAYEGANFPLLLLPSSDKMALFYQAADAVICRSGGSTVAELALFGKYAFLIPYPYAAEMHQNDNAAFYSSARAGEVIDNSSCNPAKAIEIIGRIKHELPVLSARAAKAGLGIPEASANAIAMINKCL